MKRLLLLFCLIPVILNAQDSTKKKLTLLGLVPYVDGEVRYIEVVAAGGISKFELYARAKRWIANKYKSSKDVIQLDDKEDGEIIAKGYLPFTYKHSSFFGIVESKAYHIFRVQFKDGRYRYDIEIPTIVDGTTGLTLGSPYSVVNNYNEKNGKRMLTGLDEGVKYFLSSLDSALKSKSDIEKDW